MVGDDDRRDCNDRDGSDVKGEGLEEVTTVAACGSDSGGGGGGGSVIRGQ